MNEEPSIGDERFLQVDIGDFFEGNHVVIPRGIRGVFVGFFDREHPDSAVSHSWAMARFDIPTSPGQKSLTFKRDEVSRYWGLPAKSAWEWLEIDPLV